jgi:hypothetical protein
MKVKFISENTKEARLANRRVLIIRDESNHDGEVFGILIQEWNNDERTFRIVDSAWGLCNFDDIKANIVDIVRNYDIDCFVAENNLGDPENWKEEFREFDIVDFS